MKQKLAWFAAAAACAGLAACGGTPPPEPPPELSAKTVDYGCGPGSATPMSVRYTFQNEEARAAKVVYQNQAVDLARSTTSNADMVGNTFRGNGFEWTTDAFDWDNVETAQGHMLTRQVQQNVNGQVSNVSNILLQDCRPLQVRTN